MGNMQGLESARYASSAQCARLLVAAGGVRALYYGLPTRLVRVALEMAITFTAYEHVSPVVDRALG